MRIKYQKLWSEVRLCRRFNRPDVSLTIFLVPLPSKTVEADESSEFVLSKSNLLINNYHYGNKDFDLYYLMTMILNSGFSSICSLDRICLSGFGPNTRFCSGFVSRLLALHVTVRSNLPTAPSCGQTSALQQSF